MSIYLDNPWKSVPYSIIKDRDLHQEISDFGFKVEGKLSLENLNKLKELSQSLHQFTDKQGGMFYSVYSRDLAYRKKVHEAIGGILQPYLDQYFKGFKVMLNSFVIKVPGPESEFYLHQDTTGMDEWKYSPLNLWIPLQDVDETNGCLGIVEKSHQFFSPYRGISFPAPFDPIQDTVRKYLKPLRMKAGEILMFDNRLLHNSFSNNSAKLRIAVVCGLFPEDASLMVCHKKEYAHGGKVELIEQEDAFLLSYPKFLIDCQDRPDTGNSLGFKEDPYPAITADEFEQLCQKYSIDELNYADLKSDINCHLIGEPVGQAKPEEKTSVLKKLFSIIGNS